MRHQLSRPTSFDDGQGPEEGFSFANQNKIAAYFLLRDGDDLINRFTSEFSSRLRIDV